MNFYNREKKPDHTKGANDLSIVDFAKILFEPFSEGFVVAGYGKVNHMKFLMMTGSSSVYRDAFENCRDPFINWMKLEEDCFPDQEFKQVKIPVQSGKETEGVTDLDKAMERFSIASDAFLMFGYCGNEKVVKSYASDPLKSDAVMYLQVMAMDLWARKRIKQK